MALQYSSELMTNYVPALPVPPSEKFVTCLDPITRRPMVFAINKAQVPRLNLLKEDANGQPQLIDFSSLLGLPDNQPVVAFDCQQAADLSIYLCLATFLDQSQSSILVVKPFQMNTNPTLEILPPHSVGTVQKIFMGCPDAAVQSYPMILVTGQPLSRISKGSDITRILVDPYLTSWTSLRDLELPLNAQQVLDIAPAANAFGRGIYVLCTIANSGPQIIGEFTRYDLDQNDGSLFWYNVALKTPSGASKIATFTDKRGRSSLLVGSDAGLQLYSASQATSKYSDPSLVTSDTLFKTPSTLRVAQDKDLVTVWSVGGDGSLGYTRSTSDALTQGIPVPLLPSDQVTGFSAAVSNPLQGTISQTIVVNDKIGNLTLLQQYVDTGLWRKQPFYYASSAANVEIPSYNISLHAIDRTEQPVSQGTLMISTTANVDVIVNGKPTTLTTDPTAFSLDASGEIAIIIATDSVASQNFTVSSIRDNKGVDVGFQSAVIDPSAKVIQAMNKATDLRNATTQTGEKLLKGVEGVGGEIIDKAQGLFKQLLSVNDSLQDKQKRSQLPPVQRAFAEAFHYCKQKIAEIVEWGLKQVDNVWKFVCTVAGRSIDLILDTAEKVGEAFTWIWQKIKLGINKLIEFAGFLFGWDDIIATKNTIVTFTNAVIDAGIDSMEGVRTKVNSMLDNLENALGVNTSDQVQTDDTKKKKKDNSILSSPPVKWLTERLKNGGSQENATISDEKASTGSNDDVTKVIQDDLQAAVHAVEDIISAIGGKVSDMFSGSGNASAGSLLNDIKGAAMSAMMTALRITVNGFLKVVVKLLQYFKALGNYKINMPIFTPLYKKFVGSDPSILDIVALLIAVPMTIITKLITGKAPPKLPDNFNPKIIKFMFAYNAQFLTAPFSMKSEKKQITNDANAPQTQSMDIDVDENESMAVMDMQPTSSAADDAANRDATMKAMGKLVNDQPLDDDDKKALTLLRDLIAIDQAIDQMIADIKAFVKIVPTLVAGIAASVSIIIPAYGIINSILLIRKLAKPGVVGKAAAATSEFMPSRAIRFMGIFFPFMGAIATCVFPHFELPGVIPRIMSASTTLVSSGVLTLFTLMGETVARGDEKVISMKNDFESMYQFLNAMTKTMNFGLYCAVYSDEFDDHSWPAHDVDCSALGVSGITLQYVADMCGFVTYNLLTKANLEAAAATMGVQFGAGFVSGALLISRYALQVDRKYLPIAMKS